MPQRDISGGVVIVGVTIAVTALLVYVLSRKRPANDDTFKRRPYRFDPWLKKVGYFGRWWRRAGITILGVMVVAYLVLITGARAGELDSPRRVAILIVLWVLGLIALVLLTRAFRRAGRGWRGP